MAAVLLQSIRLDSVRNLAPLAFEPGPRFNVFHGNNGQGKTNLLEAIYVIGTLRSFRTRRLAELIRFGSEEAHLQAVVVRDQLERDCAVTLKPHAREVRLDGKPVRPILHYVGQFDVVLFSPEDLLLVRRGPSDRRRFLDRAVFGFSTAYLQEARTYEHVLKNRNAFLRELRASSRLGPRDSELLSVFDEQLAQWGARVVTSRCAFLDAIRPRFQQAFGRISDSAMRSDIVYLSQDRPMAGLSAAELLGALRKRRPVDLIRRNTTLGPHHHDFGFSLEDRSAAAYASQGQMRALLLAWKTAEMDLLADLHGEPPILLLDDVSSELDQERNRYLFDLLSSHTNQCFISTTHPKHVALADNRIDYRVAAGSLSLE